MSKIDLSGLEKITPSGAIMSQMAFDKALNKMAQEVADEIDRKILYDLKTGVIDIEIDDGKNRFKRS